MMNVLRTEPALVAGAVQALLALLVAFGLPLSDAQVGAVLAVTAAVLAVVVRSTVTPTRPARPRRRL